MKAQNIFSLLMIKKMFIYEKVEYLHGKVRGSQNIYIFIGSIKKTPAILSRIHNNGVNMAEKVYYVVLDPHIFICNYKVKSAKERERI